MSDGLVASDDSRYGTVDGTVWPINVGGIEWKLRYAPSTLTREDQLVAASVIAAYEHLRKTPSGDALRAFKRLRRAQPKTASEAQHGT